LRTVGSNACTDLVERLDRQSTGIGVGLEHQRRNRTDQHGLGNTFGAVTPDVASDFSAAGRMTDQGNTVQVKLFDQL